MTSARPVSTTPDPDPLITAPLGAVWHSPALGYTAARSRRAASSAGPSRAARHHHTAIAAPGACGIRQAHQATFWHPAAPHRTGRRRDPAHSHRPGAEAGPGQNPLAGAGGACDHHLPGAGWAATICEQAPSRPQAPGAYSGHGPDYRDNPRRDPRHMACRHGCGRDRCHAQDVSPHRADRDGRLHRRVARGQAPSPQLARRSRRGQRDRKYRSAHPQRTGSNGPFRYRTAHCLRTV